MPEAVTENWAVAGSVTVTLAGAAVIAAGVSTVRMAAALVTGLPTPLTVQV